VGDRSPRSPGGRLTPAQLAFEASASVELIDELVDAGLIKRNEDGTHAPDDIARVRLAHALASGGITVADIGHEIDTGNMPFSEIPRMGIIPEVFDLDDQDYLHILQEEVTPENEHQIREAVRQCPRQAISISDE